MIYYKKGSNKMSKNQIHIEKIENDKFKITIIDKQGETTEVTVSNLNIDPQKLLSQLKKSDEPSRKPEDEEGINILCNFIGCKQ